MAEPRSSLIAAGQSANCPAANSTVNLPVYACQIGRTAIPQGPMLRLSGLAAKQHGVPSPGP